MAHLEQELARDAGQQTGVDRRRLRHAALDHEEVRLRALGELALVIPHDTLEAAPPEGFLHRQRVVQKIVRLDERVHRSGMIADDIDQRDTHAAREDVR